jgi:hypothetical protein
MLSRSARGALSITSRSANLSDGTDSPVNADSSDFKLEETKSLASADILSPASNMMTSPLTKSSADIIFSLPLRITLTLGEDKFFRASKNIPIMGKNQDVVIPYGKKENALESFADELNL